MWEIERLQSVLKNPWHTPLPRTVAVALFLFTPHDYLAARQKVLAHWLPFKAFFYSNVFFVSGIKLRCTKLRPKLVLNLLPISQRNIIYITLNQSKRYNNNSKNNNKYMTLLNADIGKSQFQIGIVKSIYIRRHFDCPIIFVPGGIYFLK